jgi:two-component system cell cycle response regulator
MATEQKGASQGRVLLVDDDEDIRIVLEMLLTSYGFEVTLAEGGRAAIEIAHREPIDVVLLDVMMPGMDGFEVCRELQRSPATASLPVILLTARDDMESRAEGMRGAVSEFLAKPANDEELIARIKTQVGVRRRQRELENLQRRAAAIGGDS